MQQFLKVYYLTFMCGLNIFREPLRPSLGAYTCTRSLWLYRWSVAVGALLVVVWHVINLPDHDQ